RNHHPEALLHGPDDPFVDFTIGKFEIGDETDAMSDVPLHVHVAGASGSFIQIVRDGKQLAMKPVAKDDFAITIDDRPEVGGVTRYRAQLVDELGQPVAITSHIYVHGIAGSGGCSTGGGAGWLV